MDSGKWHFIGEEIDCPCCAKAASSAAEQNNHSGFTALHLNLAI
jgi:hypothetical protein